MQCPDDITLFAFLSDLLNEDAASDIGQHISECPGCRQRLGSVMGWFDSASNNDLLVRSLDEGSFRERLAFGNKQASRALAPGDQVDHFRVERFLGRGGMGEVYLAWDLTLGRLVALKILRQDVVRDQKAADRFLQEARLTARFNHAHIVTIYAVGLYQKRPYLALEYLKGETLAQRARKRRLSMWESIRIGLAIAQALQEAHTHKVLHRDLKPHNVFLPQDGRLRVMDFGLAMAVEETEPGPSKHHTPARQSPGAGPLGPFAAAFETMGQGLRGTPSYMAPEQWLDQPITMASDVWALGVTLYELLVGERLFPHPLPTSMRSMASDAEPLPSVALLSPSLPTELTHLVDCCLSKDPKARPSALQAADVLLSLLPEGRRKRSEEKGPFRGLLPFHQQDADLFFGRAAEVAAFTEQLRHEPMLTVVGPSGVGKSSFVLAGVIPRLNEQSRQVVLWLRPGPRPFESLATRLLSPDTQSDISSNPSAPSPSRPEAEPVRELAAELEAAPGQLALRLLEMAQAEQCPVLLFVDQLEELYTQVADADTRAAFAQALCTAAGDPLGPVRVLLTLRDDYLWRLVTTAQSQQSLTRIVVLAPPVHNNLLETIVEPVRALGYSYEDPELPGEMIEEVAGQIAALPLLQVAGQLLWELRDPELKVLTRQAFARIGGVAGALARQADAVLSGLTARQTRLARQIFLRLVNPDGTRQVQSQNELTEVLDSGAREVLERLVAGRIIVVRKGAEESEVELTHESLIHTWDQLAGWLQESREDRVFLAEVKQATALWEKRGHRQEEVWQGEALTAAFIKARRLETLPASAANFLDAGQTEEKRRTRRKQALMGATIFMMLLAVVASIWVNFALRGKEREAQSQKNKAEAEKREAVSRRAQALREGARASYAQEALIEARAKLRMALEVEDSVMARSLWWRLKRHPVVWKKPLGATVYSVAFSPDGRTVAAACMDRSVYLFDARTGAARILRGHADQVMSVAFSADSQRLASGSTSGEVRLWNVKTGRQAAVLRGHKAGVMSVSFSPGGALLASGSNDQTVRLWDVKSRRQIAVLRGHKARVNGVTFSPAGALLASAGGTDKTVRLWNVKTRRQTAVLRGHKASVNGVSFSPGGALLASGSSDHTLRLWDVKTGRQTAVLRGHKASVWGVAFSPGGALLASAGGTDKTVRLWDVKTGRQTTVLRGHKASVRSVSFSPGGALLASAGGTDKTVHLWNVKSGRQTTVLRGHEGSVYGVSFGPGGAQLASGSSDHTLRLWDVKSGRQTAVLRGHKGGVWGVSFSPGGTQLASGSYDKTVRLWDVKSGRQTAVLRGHKASVLSVSFSPGGGLLATGSYDKTVRLWDVNTGRQTAVLRGHKGSVYGVSFSPGGAQLASGGYDKTVCLWDVNTGRQTARFRGHKGNVWGVSFSPGGALLVSGSYDKTVRLWSVKARKGRVLGRHAGRVFKVHFHPDGKRVGASSSDGTARIWDLRTGGHIELRGHRAEVNFIRFNADGKLAVTSSDDGTVRLWHADTGKPVWRAPFFRRSSLELFTHSGWIKLGPGGSSKPANPSAGWRKIVARDGKAGSESPNGKRLCLSTFSGHLERWDLVADHRQMRLSLPAIAHVIAVPSGCVTLVRKAVWLHGIDGTTKLLQKDANAVTAVTAVTANQELLIATGRTIHVHALSGRHLKSYPTQPGIVAVGRVEDRLVIGFRNGQIELLPMNSRQQRNAFIFESTPSSPVVRILPGPMGTLIASFANGVFGIWDLTNGLLLNKWKLHGPVVHMVMRFSKLYAASELGQIQVVDLGVFTMSYCQLLRELWKEVPVIWESGRPIKQRPPRNHRCRRRSGGPRHGRTGTVP